MAESLPTCLSHWNVLNTLLSTWNRHEAELRGWLRAHAPVPGEVDDILQDVFVKTMNQREKWGSIKQPRAWLFEVTRNTLTDRLRALSKSAPLPDNLEDIPAPQTQTDTVDALASVCLPRVLSELDAQDREIIELCDLNDMDQASYAELKGLTLSAAKSRIQRARRRMRERMVSVCQVSFDSTGHVDDFVPRTPPKP
ncbi:RNA polymerase sigma-70 factor (ECF subfamily) [Hydrogenophaga palleronii]|uniref:RNA polymerase sigma factor n=1 Tax=Hydrogenophaga palleronii TaxID=65655 RepID=A0ABU1WUY3_9BURK|nr:sigma-70 family RNA polymerase sigma factor [Hydrogenophaga palleronii]MDR7152874.1 RNA polymerase sigma-70 factor (ECF subfamily) [Hydrogenophaga palleronii]